MDLEELKHDPFCWKCCRDDANQQCSECERSFHGRCIDIKSEWIDGDKGWICPVCVKVKSASIVDNQKGLQMLAIIIKRIYNDSTYMDFRTSPTDGSKPKERTDDIIVKPMNLNILKEKLDKYGNYEQFLADVEWMVHNCVILYSESHEKTRLARILLNYFIDEIESVKKCAECYANATTHSGTWFTLACNEPHLLIWAKQKGFNHWPAKLMSIDGSLINVRFFGDHTHADIPANNCFLYSKTNPGRLKHTSHLYNVSLKEADEYILNIRKKFGTFNLVDHHTCIDPTKYESYMAEAFPDLVQYHRANIDEAASAENFVKMEHIELPLLDDPTSEEPTEKRARFMEKDVLSKDGNTIEGSNQVARKENATSLMKLSFQRNIDDCFNELMKMNEQHTHAKINLQMEYNAKLEQMQRAYDERVEEIKKNCFSNAGF